MKRQYNKRFLFIIIFFFLALSLYSQSTVTNIEVLNILSLNFDTGLKIRKGKYVLEDGWAGLMVKYGFNFGGGSFTVYLRPKKGVTKEEILERYKDYGMKLSGGNGSFGWGETDKIFSDLKDVEFIRANTKTVRRIIAPWGTEYTQDSILYLFNLKNDLFKDCLIQGFNLWVWQDPDVQNLSNSFINDLIEKKDPRAKIYKKINDAILSLELY